MEAVGPANYVGCLRSADWRHLDSGRQDGWQSWDRNGMNDVESAFGENVSVESAFAESAFEEVACDDIPSDEVAFGGITFPAKMVLGTFVVVIEVTEAYGTL